MLTEAPQSITQYITDSMNQIREIQRINDEELSRGISGTSASWHNKYANSAWCFVGNLDVKLTEGDVIAVMSEYGEIDDLHLVREEDTGKSKGFCFLKYEDARSCVLAVDNMCGVNLLGRSMRVDHVENYRLPKSLQEKEEELQKRLAEHQGLEGHAYDGVELANDFSLGQGQDLFAKPTPSNSRKPQLKDQEEDGLDDEERRRLREEKRRRKEEKQQEKDARKRERDEKRMEREEKRREKRAKKMNKDDDGASKGDRDEDIKNSKKRKESRHRSHHHKSDSKKDKKRKRSDKRSRSRSRSRSPSRKKEKEP